MRIHICEYVVVMMMQKFYVSLPVYENLNFDLSCRYSIIKHHCQAFMGDAISNERNYVDCVMENVMQMIIVGTSKKYRIVMSMRQISTIFEEIKCKYVYLADND